MAFERCEQPADLALAINLPIEDRGFSHLQALTGQLGYWASGASYDVGIAANSYGEIGGHDELFTKIIENALRTPTQAFLGYETEGTVITQTEIDFFYKRRLGILAASILSRRLFKAGRDTAAPAENIGTPTVSIMFDGWLDDGDLNPPDPALHVLPVDIDRLLPSADGDAADEWFRSSGLYVRRVAPSQPSDAIRMFLMEIECPIQDFEARQTVYPYIPS